MAVDLALVIGARVNWEDYIELPARTVHFRTGRRPQEGGPAVPPRFFLDRCPLVPLQPTLVHQPSALRPVWITSRGGNTP